MAFKFTKAFLKTIILLFWVQITLIQYKYKIIEWQNCAYIMYALWCMHKTME